MKFLSQKNFPRLWFLFQKVVGSTKDKQKLAIRSLNNHKKILEIGCSVGNVSTVFKKFKDIEFSGIDIDQGAINLAQKRFLDNPKFKFRCISLEGLAQAGEKFDYVVFANILHHVDDITARALLADVKKVLEKDGIVTIMEPEKKKNNYGILFKLIYLFEQGEFRRSREELIALISGSGYKLSVVEDVEVSSDGFPFVKVACLTYIVAC